jgi:hypothetical protein
MGKQPSR